MAQANTFVLDKLNLILQNVHQLLADPGVESLQRDALQAWWRRRSAKLNQQLLQRLTQATTARERVFLRLACLLLQPQQPGMEARLADDLGDYTSEISEWVATEIQNISGDVRLQRAGTALEIAKEQIEDLERLIGEIRSVIYAWEDVKSRASFADNTISTKIGDLRRVYLAARSSSHEQPSQVASQSLIDLLWELAQLQEVIVYVSSNLETAYRENSPGLWEALHQKLHGFHDVPSQAYWVSQGSLRQHISYRWIETAYQELRNRRTELQQRMDNIVELLRYEYFEGEQLDDDGHTSGRLSEENKATEIKEKIRSERRRNSILQEKSVLEQARDDLTYIREHAIVEGYQTYTKQSDQRLVDKLTRKLIAADVLPRDRSLSDFLDSRIKIIEDLRKSLLPVVRRGFGDNPLSLTIQKQAYYRAARFAQAAQFEKARQSCSEGESQLTQTLSYLETSQGQATPPLPGMAKRLLDRIEQETNKLKVEKESISQINARIDDLERDYRKWREQFETNLAEWQRRNAGGLLGRFRRAGASHFLQSASQALCKCQTLCPEDEWVQIWANMGFMPSGQCAKLNETDWMEQHFHAQLASRKVV